MKKILAIISLLLLFLPTTSSAQILLPTNPVTVDSSWFINDIRTWCGVRGCWGYGSKQCDDIQAHVRRFYPEAYCVIFYTETGDIGGIQFEQPYKGICLCYR